MDSRAKTLKGTGESLNELITDLKELTPKLFKEAYGDAFLVYSGLPSDLKPHDRAWHATLWGEDRVSGQQMGQALGTTLIYQIRHTERTLSKRFVTVGRLEGTNDIIINDRSISGLHAVFEQSAKGGYLVRDVGSRNGTFVGGVAVPKDSTHAVRPGDSIRFGRVIVIFLDAIGLVTLAKAAAKL